MNVSIITALSKAFGILAAVIANRTDDPQFIETLAQRILEASSQCEGTEHAVLRGMAEGLFSMNRDKPEH